MSKWKFLDDDNIYKCKCSTNITCKYCTKESNQYNLCVSCNNEQGYFQKIDENNNVGSFINCYNNETIQGGYYLNISKGYYEKCYETCNKCSELGNEDDNKCTQCISTHEFRTDFENDNNCYPKCNKYYYFDLDKKFHCVDSCTGTYNKLIENKNKCIDDCSKDNENKFFIRTNAMKIVQ